MRSYRLEIGQGNIHVKAPSRQKAILQAARVYSKAAPDLRLDTFLPAVVRVQEGRRSHAYPMEKFLAQVLHLAQKDREEAQKGKPQPPRTCLSCLNFDKVEARCMAPPEHVNPVRCWFIGQLHLTQATREALR